MRHSIIRNLIAFLAIAVSTNMLAMGQQHRNSQKVFVDWGGVNHELVLDLYRRRIRIRKPKVLEAPIRYRVDGLEFVPDKTVIDARYKENEITSKLTADGGALFYHRRPVILPQGVEMRKVWQAVLWKGWIICLGRTSKTGKEAQLKPPFFATELITFSATERIAAVQYVSFEPPADIRLYILNRKRH